MKIFTKAIKPNPEQPRVEFDQNEMQSLAESIQQHGLINPICVEEVLHEDGQVGYLLIDGERRWRAHLALGLDEIEAQVQPGKNGNGPRERLEMALAANLQRVDLDPVEEGRAYFKMRQMGMKVEAIANKMGRATSYIRMRLEILELPAEIQDLFSTRALPLSSQVTAAVRNLPEESQVRVARNLAMRNATIASILSTCKRLSNQAQFGTAKHSRPEAAKENFYSGHFCALNLVVVGNTLRADVERTCKNCALFEDACVAVCRQCPLVDFLKRVTKEENKPAN